jgi:hypothetical protein
MSEPNLADLRAMETILRVMTPLQPKEQIRVLAWVIDKLDLALDMKLASRDLRPQHRNYIDLAWEMVPDVLNSENEFLAAAAPDSLADRVLVMATYLQMHADDPDTAFVTGREINGALRKMRLAVPNITDCIYTLMKRSPAHMVEWGRVPDRKSWKGYQVTESGIQYVYERIVQQASAGKP